MLVDTVGIKSVGLEDEICFSVLRLFASIFKNRVRGIDGGYNLSELFSGKGGTPTQSSM